MFVKRVIEDYSKMWNGNATRDDFHRFHCRLSQAMALGVMTRDEYDEIKEKWLKSASAG